MPLVLMDGGVESSCATCKYYMPAVDECRLCDPSDFHPPICEAWARRGGETARDRGRKMGLRDVAGTGRGESDC